jgi:hypothetical protein
LKRKRPLGIDDIILKYLIREILCRLHSNGSGIVSGARRPGNEAAVI